VRRKVARVARVFWFVVSFCGSFVTVADRETASGGMYTFYSVVIYLCIRGSCSIRHENEEISARGICVKWLRDSFKFAFGIFIPRNLLRFLKRGEK